MVPKTMDKLEAAVSNGKTAGIMDRRAFARPVGRSCQALMLAALCLLAVAVPLESLAANKLYRWTDEHGVVHYTDKLPPDVINRGNVELSKQGMPVKKTEPTGTAEQQKAVADEAARQRVLAKEREDIARQDRAVLDSYTTESDIELARNRALKTIDSALQSALSYTAQLTKRKSALEEKKAAPTDKNGTAAYERMLARIEADLAAQNALVTQKKKEIVATNAKYDEDKARWHAALARKQYLDSALPPTVANGAVTTPSPAQAGKTAKK